MLSSPKFCFCYCYCYCYCYVVLPGHLSQHAKAATAEGLTFSDPIHKKSARNLNLYNFCHSAKKLTARRYPPLIHINDAYFLILFSSVICHIVGL
jgi:hypothetical protein